MVKGWQLKVIMIRVQGPGFRVDSLKVISIRVQGLGLAVEGDKE